jgi:hypothetical protein
VQVSTQKVRLRSGEVDPELAPGLYIRLDVKDNGVGMDPEQQARCFEPFFTTKNVDRGTGVGLTGSGLGLSAAYSIAKQHDGLITVHSVPGEGSTFSMYLPILSVRASVTPELTAVTPRKTSRGGVLLLGIEPGVQPFVSSIFESLGYRSRSVFDTMQAVEVLKHERDRWGFVVADLDTLGDSASAGCAQLIAEFSELCLLAVAASPKEWSEKLQPSPRIEILEKPLGVWGVDAALERLTVRPLAASVEKIVETNGRPHGGDGHAKSGTAATVIPVGAPASAPRGTE